MGRHKNLGLTISTLYESIQLYCQSISGINAGTYNGDMIAAAKVATGLARDMTANEAELLLLQHITGDLTDTLAGMHSRWPSSRHGAALPPRW